MENYNQKQVANINQITKKGLARRNKGDYNKPVTPNDL
jgi:hypothetical protein